MHQVLIVMRLVSLLCTAFSFISNKINVSKMEDAINVVSNIY